MDRARIPAVLLVLVASGCGGGAKPAAQANDESSESGLQTPEMRCIARARAPHDRRRDEPEKISVKHVLVQFAGAKKAKEGVTRSRGDACLRALEALTQLKNGETFADVVAIYSDEPGAATREGLVGAIERKDVAPAFADAAFELNHGEVSWVVETDFGYHVILRAE